jgi:outer membrane protein assembly factor BamB
MKNKFFFLVLSMLALALFLGGCASGLTPSSWPGINANEELAFVAGGPYVYAVNLQTGVEVWRFPEKAATSTPYFATPQLTPDGQQLIVGSFDHKLYSLNPQSGVQNWVFSQAKDRWIGGVLITADTIYGANADYNVYAISFSGEAKWVTPFVADQSIWGSPVTDGTNIYFGTLGRNVFAVNATTGKLVWDKKLDAAVLGSPVLGPADSLYVGTFGTELVVLDTRNGNVLRQESVSPWIWSGPLLDDSNVYTGDANGMFYAFPLASTGTPWTQQLNGAIIGTPILDNETIITGTESGNLYFLDQSGGILKTITLQGKIYSTPVVAKGLILVALSEGETLLTAIDMDGAIKWSFAPAK